jgi:hypothetical protein
MRYPRALPFLLLFLLSMLAVLDALSVPDPAWIPGIYDDGDHDAVIGFGSDVVVHQSGFTRSLHPSSIDASHAREAASPGSLFALDPVRAPPSL